MRIVVDHRTLYRFSDPQARIVEMLRLTPSDTREQTVVSWSIDVNVDARLRSTRDGFGNAIHMLYAEGPIDALEVSVTGEVLTSEANGLVQGSTEPLPALFFRRATARTAASGEVAQFARDATVGATDLLDRLHRFNLALCNRFEAAPTRRDQGFSAAAAFRLEQAAPRDLAHMFIVGAHALGQPARYVSGYRSDGAQALCAPHAWAEAHIDNLGWVAFDPAAGLSTDESYVRVAIGLDANGATPIVGHRIGQGSEELDVDLHVEQRGSDA